MAKEQVLALDGNTHTLVMFDREDGWQLLIGGGPDFYVITLGNSDENLTFFNQSGDEAHKLEICAGGQLGKYPETICASIEQVKMVVEYFFENRERQLNWI